MSINVLELNDSDLRIIADGRIVARSPGYAIVHRDEAELGEAAFRKSRVNPHSSYNEFWQSLSEAPLRKPTKRYRHHADLAFAHLRELHERAGRPQQLLFAVPGDMGRDQLALLLGLSEASGIEAIGLVDTAVAGCAAAVARGRYAHIDMHLHRTVVTLVDVTDSARRESIRRVEHVGFEDVYARCAAAVADVFIRMQRFDPQADANAEQALYDNLPNWLGAIDRNQTIVIEMAVRGTNYRVRLDRNVLDDALQPLVDRIRAVVPAGVHVLLSDRVTRLPWLATAFGRIETVGPEDIYLGCVSYRAQSATNGAALSFSTQVPSALQPRIDSTAFSTLPAAVPGAARAAIGGLHILGGFRAAALGSMPLFVHRSGAIATHRAPDVTGSIATGAGGAPTLTPLLADAVYVNGMPITAAQPVSAGDVITIAGCDQSFRIILVGG